MKKNNTAIVLLCAAGLLAGPVGAANASARKKTVPAAATELAAPALAGAISRFDRSSGAMGHPRLFKGQADYAGIVAATRAERALALRSLIDTLKRHPVRAIAPALKGQIAAYERASWWQQDRLLEGMAESAFAWYVTRAPWLLDETVARMRLFGPTVVEHGCRGDIAHTRDFVWYFALAYDFAYPALQSAERALVHELIASCARAGLASTAATLRRQPDNGIAFNALGKLVGALLIVRGDMPQAAGLLKTALPAYVGALSPWGGADGGFANGSSYALWDAGESLLAWDLVERVLGVPLYRKPWLAELSRFITYTLPPGTPAGAFGDGAEVQRGEEWARLGKAIANRSSTPLARWYSSQLKGEDVARLQILLSPREKSAALPAAAPDSASFGSVGVVAMHSALDDPKRVSVLFKSSPFGSVNHSHADQNSFVIYARGKVMAMDSGSYDSYNSAHWRKWYKQTRAHNAITFDGGQGQDLGLLGQGSRARSGRIVRFTHTPAYDIAVGEASAAYGGGVRQARRTLVFIRPSTLVVVDQLRAATARTWEWNLHTPVPLSGSPGNFKVTMDGVSMCGTLASPGQIGLSSEEGYPVEPAKDAGAHHWHRFALARPQSNALFVSVLRIDCGTAPPTIRAEGETGLVTVAGRTVEVTATGATVRD